MRTTPASNITSAVLRLPRRAAGRLKRHLRDWQRGETDATYFDAFDLGRLNAVLTAHGRPPLEPGAAQAEADEQGAARFALATLADPRVRRRFPDALDGTGYRDWLCGTVSDRAAAHVRAGFARGLARPVTRIYDMRTDLRKEFPLALTPRRLGDFFLWLVTYGRRDFDLADEEILWFVVRAALDPSRGLAAEFLLTPEWQHRVPHGLTRFGWDALKAYLAERYGVTGRWLKAAPCPEPFGPWDELRLLRTARPDLDETFPHGGDVAAILDWLGRSWGVPHRVPDAAWRGRLAAELAAGVADRPAVNLVAHFRYVSGLQEAAFKVADGLHRHGVATAERDVPVVFSRLGHDDAPYHGLELSDTSVYVAAANSFLDENYRLAGLHPRRGVYRIAVWYWELESVPPEWVERAGLVNEIWAPTKFIGDAMRKAMPQPVYDMLPGLHLPDDVPALPRGHFGLADDGFLFMFMFDISSILARKNPLGLIEAYRRAFAGDPRVRLAIKVTRGERMPERKAQLQRAADAAGVTVIDRVLSRAETLALVKCCDCYASLHRSEGLGLTMAEAMWCGKPAIATGYSGNVDFMTPENSLLVGYDLAEITEDFSPYPKGCVWAEPRIDHAAELMRWVVDHPAEAQALGARASESVRRTLAIDAAGRRMADRLAAIRRAGLARVA